MSAEWFGILLLGVLFVAIFIGFPIAFTLIAVAAIGGYAMLGPLALHLMTLQVFSVMRDPTLASVPFFLFMGFLLEQSGYEVGNASSRIAKNGSARVFGKLSNLRAFSTGKA